MRRINMKMTIALTWLIMVMIPAFVQAAEPQLVCSFHETAGIGEGAELSWYVRGLKEEPSADGVSVIFGGEKGEVSGVEKITDSGSMLRTIILFDNSLSMVLTDPENAKRAKALANAFIDSHGPQEWFSVYSYDKEMHLLGEGTDYASLKEKINSISFKNQDAYLLRSLQTVLDDCRNADASQDTQENMEKQPLFTRIVLITDGTDDNSEPPSFSDIGTLIMESENVCPVYAGICVWERDISGIRELASVTEASGGRVFMLDEYKTDELPALVLEVNDTDHNIWCFRIKAPLKSMDGKEKDVRLTLTDAGGQELHIDKTLSADVFAEPETYGTDLSEDFLDASETEPGPEEEQYTDRTEDTETISEEVISEEAMPEEEAKTEEETIAKMGTIEEKAQPGEKAYYAFAAAVVVLSLGIFGFVFRRFYSLRKADGETGRESDRESNVIAASGNGHEATVSMWDKEGRFAEGIMVILSDILNQKEQYVFYVGDEAVIGRGSSCDVVIETDRSVSKRHLILSARQGILFAEDCESTNGTFINDLRISAPKQLRNGDILGIGNKRMQVHIEPQHREM